MLPDPELTALGKTQCLTLKTSLYTRFGHYSSKDVAVIVSPMLRTMQTATIGLDWLKDDGVVFEASADWQGERAFDIRRTNQQHSNFNTENSDEPCDTGSPISKWQAEFPHIDFSKVDPIWPDKTSPAAKRYANTRSAVIERGKLVLEALFHRPEKLIYVVSHGAFLRAGVSRFYYHNADYRIFDFGPKLTETGRRTLTLSEGMGRGALGLSREEPVPLGAGLED